MHACRSTLEDPTFRGVDHVAAESFVETLRSMGALDEVSARRVIRVVQRGRRTSYSLGTLINVSSVADEFRDAVERSVAAVLIGGTTGTNEVSLTARRAGRPIFPFTGTGGFAGRLAAGDGSAEAEIASRAQADEIARSLVDRIDRILIQTASASPILARFIWDYEELRQAHQKGPTRTAKMDDLIAEVQLAARRLNIDRAAVEQLYATGGDGARVIALACCMSILEEPPTSPIANAILAPRTLFEQWTAVQAAGVVVHRLAPLAAEPCVAAILRQLQDPGSLLNDKEDSDRLAIALPIISSFAAKVGLSKDASVEIVQEWIEAGASRGAGDGRCVAVFGSDTTGIHVGFCRSLGQRLAAYGWRLVAGGRGTSVGAEVFAGFRTSKRRTNQATLYTTSTKSGSPDQPTTSVATAHEGSVKMIRQASCAIVIAGGRGTKQECRMANAAGLPVVALPFTGGTAAHEYPQTRRDLADRGVPEALLALLDPGADHQSDPEWIVRIMNIVVLHDRRAKSHLQQ